MWFWPVRADIHPLDSTKISLIIWEREYDSWGKYPGPSLFILKPAQSVPSCFPCISHWSKPWVPPLYMEIVTHLSHTVVRTGFMYLKWIWLMIYVSLTLPLRGCIMISIWSRRGWSLWSYTRQHAIDIQNTGRPLQGVSLIGHDRPFFLVGLLLLNCAGGLICCLKLFSTGDFRNRDITSCYDSFLKN